MITSSSLFKQKRAIREIGYIVFRNVFILVNIITLAVVALLIIFGDIRAGIFLGIILVLNITAGLVQEMRAWFALTRLQLITALRVTRIRADGAEESLLAEEIKKGDRIKLRLGDQIPCDGVFISAKNLEINEALITGESDSIPILEGKKVSAGSIITAGSGILEVEIVFRESRISRMTEGIKKYSVSVSPIQRSINSLVKWTGYILLVSLVFVIIRGVMVHDPAVRIVTTIGALSSMLVPQGLVFAVTLLFAYGAANLYKRDVLLQEVNATEKLGRIKNLCMDKTGTLTETTLSVEKMYTPHGLSGGDGSDKSEKEAKNLVSAYVYEFDDPSQSISAIKKFLGEEYEKKAKNVESVPFSSWRQYGGICLGDGKGVGEGKDAGDCVVLAGTSKIFIPHLSSDIEKKWLNDILETHARHGKHVLCFVKTNDRKSLSDFSDATFFSNATFSVVAVFVFESNLREGIRDAVAFFQNRGVSIRIISGDDADTVRSVAVYSGIMNAESVVTGEEMEAWSDADFENKTRSHSIFARIKPEQKEKIILALKRDGFTAMIGDGANDALAIKNADLGIAMFEGAPATRQLAAVVLMKNSFIALPCGVRLADNVIKTIEIFSSLFFNQVAIGFFFFIVVSACGYSYPLTPFNITFLNYFTIGMPGFLIAYWAVRPPQIIKPADTTPFLKKVLPFAIASAVLSTVGLALIFFLSPESVRIGQSNMPVVFEFILLCYVFFMLAPTVYFGFTTWSQKKAMLWLALIEAILFFVALKIPLAVSFFDIANMSVVSIVEAIIVACVFGCAEYALARYFISKNIQTK